MKELNLFFETLLKTDNITEAYNAVRDSSIRINSKLTIEMYDQMIKLYDECEKIKLIRKYFDNLN